MIKSKLLFWSDWHWEHWRNGIMLRHWKNGNTFMDEGIIDILNHRFFDPDTNDEMRIAVFENDYTPLETDTYAVPGYTECEALQDANRPVCQFAQTASKSISNVSNKASITFSLNKTIYGGALVGGGTGAATIGDKVGDSVLYCAAKFTNGSQAFVANDVAKITVTITGASAS